MHRFKQVDVFGSGPFRGNPVAVVADADGLDEAELSAFARWTNLSETTFLLRPTDPAADYRLRIFTPGGELPFAGHPTLGSAHAWLEAGRSPREKGVVVQECGAGLVRLRVTGELVWFAAPPLIRSGPVDDETLARTAASLGVPRDELLSHQWIDNGPGWLVVELASAGDVLALRPDFAAMGGLSVGVFGAHPDGAETRYEVRAFVPHLGVPEDPVTGSLNAGLATWLFAEGRVPDEFVVAQGTAIGRSGRVAVQRDAEGIWIGGSTVTVIDGSVEF